MHRCQTSARFSRKEPGEPGGARRSQEEPGGARGSQEEPGGARKSQEEPGEPGGGKRSQEEPGGARRSQEKAGGASSPDQTFFGFDVFIQRFEQAFVKPSNLLVLKPATSVRVIPKEKAT